MVRWLVSLLALCIVGDARAEERVDFRVVPSSASGFAAVKLWVPSRPATAKVYPAVVLLYGNQGALRDPAWLVGLGTRGGFRRRILIVPGLRDGYHWDREGTRRAVVGLVAQVARSYPVDRKRVFLVGHSAGGSRVIELAKAAPREFAGVVSVAGGVVAAHSGS